MPAEQTAEQIAANMRNWDERVADHVTAYGAEAFADDPNAIGLDVEVALLAPHLPGGTVAGLDVVHLQCHIGTDTISLARRGARVVGTDLSGEAVATATALAERAGIDATFVQAANEDAPDALGRTFDLVYTTVGVLTWLPDLAVWAEAIARLLKPGGALFLYDGHPFLYTFQFDRDDDQLVMTEPYFALAADAPRRFDDGTTYASASRMSNATTYEWPHPLSEIFGALLGAGLQIEAFDEHRSMPWRALPSMGWREGGFRLPDGAPDAPLMFSLIARRPAD
ncbi:class I SAM-dependent methyltransferase [Schumannella luteola]|uniref:SAM-dependent methyltransferase n=1 Tax=Schumannella luteola TaxID=472059 RepID=A0A852YEK9_9MICO|nr:SAM-dependent methyltransferase [Schumannella luteola]